MYDNAQRAGGGRDTLAPMKPNFTDQYRHLRGYVRAESTDVAKTWAAARCALGQDRKHPENNVLRLKLQPRGKTAT
jgi:hypothetical protein